MPLIEGKEAKTSEGMSENISREVYAGKPQKQAVAIAYAKAREAGSKKKEPTLEKSESKHCASCTCGSEIKKKL